MLMMKRFVVVLLLTWTVVACTDGGNRYVPWLQKNEAKLQNNASEIQKYKQLAEQGDAESQYTLGYMFVNGWGATKDYAQALKWFRKSANQGYGKAQHGLGLMYANGWGVKQDYAVALSWWRKDADQGSASAQNNIGLIYHKGMGVSQDYVEAAKWYRMAAEQGDASAQSFLGGMYVLGQGIPKDYAKAYFWLSLAADQGDAKAVKLRDAVAKKMTPANIAEGQRLTQNWLPKAPQQVADSNPQDIIELRQQLKKIEGLITGMPSPVATPQLSSAPKFPSKQIIVHFAKSKPHPDDIAVIIGNANYEKGKDIPNVTPAYADAEGMKNYAIQALGIAEDNVIFLKDATQKDLVGTFGNNGNHHGRLFRYLTPNKSKVFVFYSGHGAPGAGDTNYLVPTDAEASQIDLNGYSLNTLYQNLSKLPAKSVTVVLEACFSGASEAGTVINNASPVYLKAKDTGIPSNITVIAAGAANQIASWEKDKSHGLFTKSFLMGMSGEADNDKDSKVSWTELRNYLAETVTRSAMRNYGREQTPQIVVGSGG